MEVVQKNNRKNFCFNADCLQNYLRAIGDTNFIRYTILFNNSCFQIFRPRFGNAVFLIFN